MPGSEIVNANMIAWEKLCFEISKGLIKAHADKSLMFAKGNHPWESRTGRTEGDLYAYTSGRGTRIEGEVGYISVPSGGDYGGSKGWWLENPNQNVHAYGNGPAFGTRFQILEKAISEDVDGLFSTLAAIWTGGGFGFGVTGGNIGLH
jgi:hypothetical protein